MPPTITIPNGCRLVDAAPSDIASGNEPNAMARLVIRIGRKRMTRCFDHRLGILPQTFLTLLVGKLHDQDTVLRNQTNQHDHTDLRKDIRGLPEYLQAK